MSHAADEDFAKPIAKLIEAFASLLRLAVVHDSKNPIFTPVLTQFAAHYQVVNPSDLEVTLSLVDESVFINRQLVRLNRNQAANAASLKKIYDRLQVDELTFVGAQSPQAMLEFIAILQRHWSSATPSAIKDDPTLTNVRLRKLDSKRVASNVNSIKLDPRQNVLRCYASLTITLHKALEQMHAGESWRTPALRRAVQGLAEASDGHESLLAGLTRFPNFVGDLHFHLSAVTALTMIMARKLGLKRAALTDVCMAAALHDIGRFTQVATPQHEAGAEQSRASVESLLRNTSGAISDELFVQAAASYECSLWHEPTRLGAMTPGTLAQLIAVPCAFDLLSMPRPPPHNVGARPSPSRHSRAGRYALRPRSRQAVQLGDGGVPGRHHGEAEQRRHRHRARGAVEPAVARAAGGQSDSRPQGRGRLRHRLGPRRRPSHCEHGRPGARRR